MDGKTGCFRQPGEFAVGWNIFGHAPKSASEHLLRLDTASAAAILIKLDQRAASAILNDIAPEKAAKLTAMMVAASRKSDAGDRP